VSYQPIRFASLETKQRLSIYSSSQLSLCDPTIGREARNWLYERGIDTPTIASFKLGYVPHSIPHSFSGRMVIPIFDQHNDLLVLSVRPVTNDKAILDEYGKYWNERYDKGWHLFGLNLARLPIIQQRFVIVVEGQFDVIAMHAFGFHNVVGVLGGSFTPWQAQLLMLWTNQIVLMFDGDAAGKDHTEKAAKMLSQYVVPMLQSTNRLRIAHIKMAIANLPKDLDPNKYLIERGSQEMRKLVGVSMKKEDFTLPANYLKESAQC